MTTEGIGMPNWDFLLGFVVAGIFGLVMQKLRAAQKKVGSYKKPQSVTQKTDKTPLQIVKDSIAAFLGCVLWAVFLIALLAVIVWLTFNLDQ
jgi:uncharacterized membrane protein